MSLTSIAAKAKDKQQEAPPAPAPTPATSTAVTVPTSGLMAVIANADTTQGLAFPTLTVTGGAGGGLMNPHKSVPPEIANKMPQGKMPVDGVFIGLRTEVCAWPTGYDDRDPNMEAAPVWSAAISAQDQDGALLMQEACKQYQFTKKDNKTVFDFAASQVGHIRPVLQVAVWSKTLGDIIVVQSHPSYESWLEGLRGLLRLADKDSGALAQFPMSLRVNTVPRASKSFSWVIHVFAVDPLPNAQGAEIMSAFKTWRTTLSAEKVEQVNDWLAALDRPMTEQAKAALVKAKTLKA